MGLMACQPNYPNGHKPAARLPSRQQLCTHLRHQLIFEQNPIGPNSPNNFNQQNLPITKARLANDYERYNCDALE